MKAHHKGEIPAINEHGMKSRLHAFSTKYILISYNQKNEILFLTALGGTNLGLNKKEVLRTISDSKV